MSSQTNKKTAIEKWEKSRRFWYNFYLFMGVGINFVIYFTKPYGFDPSNNVALGASIGLGIPLLSMFIGVFLHQKVIGL